MTKKYVLWGRKNTFSNEKIRFMAKNTFLSSMTKKNIFWLWFQVNLVIRLRQSRDRDTMVSSCSVTGERKPEEEERRQRHLKNFFSEISPNKDLTDFRGCSLDQVSVLFNFFAAKVLLWWNKCKGYHLAHILPLYWLGYAMLWYAMTYHDMLCQDIPWHAMLCYAVLCCAVLCCAVLCCAVLCCAVLCCAVLCCAW